jgi:hypothetical protein
MDWDTNYLVNKAAKVVKVQDVLLTSMPYLRQLTTVNQTTDL